MHSRALNTFCSLTTLSSVRAGSMNFLCKFSICTYCPRIFYPFIDCQCTSLQSLPSRFSYFPEKSCTFNSFMVGGGGGGM